MIVQQCLMLSPMHHPNKQNISIILSFLLIKRNTWERLSCSESTHIFSRTMTVFFCKIFYIAKNGRHQNCVSQLENATLLVLIAIGAFTPQYFSHKGSSELSSWELFSSHELNSDRVHTGISPWGRIRQMKPLTSLLLLLLWVYWQAANNFTV